MISKFSFEEKNVKILVADDMSMSRETARKLLLGLGFSNLKIVADGKQAWNELEKAHQDGNPFKLVLTDWMMPELDGVQLLEKLQGANWPEIPPVVLLTAESDTAQVLQAVKKGISNYVQKPLTSESLKNALVSLSNRSSAASAKAE
jgi:two-component system chemotaxis response regulator CheY